MMSRLTVFSVISGRYTDNVDQLRMQSLQKAQECIEELRSEAGGVGNKLLTAVLLKLDSGRGIRGRGEKEAMNERIWADEYILNALSWLSIRRCF